MVNLKEGNISLILDGYNDLFSDFDPRGYSERSLSDDFLLECKRATREKEDVLELRLLVPKKMRVFKDEFKIKQRIKSYFFKHFHQKQKEISELKYQGIRWFFVGVLFMMSGAYIQKYSGFFIDLLTVILEPAGWFSFWEGLGKIFMESKKESPDLTFHKKMANVNIKFLDS